MDEAKKPVMNIYSRMLAVQQEIGVVAKNLDIDTSGSGKQKRIQSRF